MVFYESEKVQLLLLIEGLVFVVFPSQLLDSWVDIATLGIPIRIPHLPIGTGFKLCHDINLIIFSDGLLEGPLGYIIFTSSHIARSNYVE